MRSYTLRFGFWIALILLIVVPWTMFVGHIEGHRVSWVPFSPPLRIRDIVANVLLYVPFGYLCVRRRTPGGVVDAALWALLLSVATEGTQLFSHGRFPSATDVVCNTFGSFVGALMAARMAPMPNHGARTRVNPPGPRNPQAEGTEG
jgi:glycopeptide antibiotics resistance protein